MKKVALVTGASSGIGKSATIELQHKGFEVFAAARRIEKMKDLSDVGINVISMDVTSAESVQKGINYVVEKYGKIDVLVNNAGYGLLGTVEDTPIDDAKYQFEVNVFGLSRITQLVIPYMRKNGEGRIINISSIGGRIYTPYGAYYHATKHAIEGYSDCLRYELKPFNIKVVVIQPGIIDSEWGNIAAENLIKNSASGAYATDVKNYATYMEKIYSAGKMSKPGVIGKLIAKAATIDNPAPRYAAGKLSGLSLFTRKILSDRLFDRALRAQIKFISKN